MTSLFNFGELYYRVFEMRQLLEFDSIIACVRPFTLGGQDYVMVGTLDGTLGMWKLDGTGLVEITELNAPISIVCDVYTTSSYAVTYLSTYDDKSYRVIMKPSGLNIIRLSVNAVINRTLITDKSVILAGSELYIGKHRDGILDESTLVQINPGDETFKVAFVKDKSIYQTTHEGTVYKITKHHGQIHLETVPSLIADAATGYSTPTGNMCVASVHGYNETYRTGSLIRLYKETSPDQWAVAYERLGIKHEKEYPYPDVFPIEGGASIGVSPNEFIIFTGDKVTPYKHRMNNTLCTAPFIYRDLMFYTTWDGKKAILYLSKF